MKILVVSHSCATPLNQQLYAELERVTGWDITLAVPRDWRDEFGNVLPGERLEGFRGRVVQVPVWKNGSIILHLYRKGWRSWLQRERFDFIYVNHEPYALATAQICLANRFGLRAPFAFYSCQNILKRYPPPFSWLERAVYGSSTLAFPITEAVGEVLQRKGYRQRIAVLPLPFDPVTFSPRPRAEAPEALRPLGTIPLIGFIGRLVPEKGLATLARALGELRDLEWRLVVIGTGAFQPEFDRLTAAAGIGDRIVHLGYVPHAQTPAHLAAFDVLVLPSETQKNWKEQFGRVITEALACEVPVVGSDSGEIPNLIRRSRGGVVFPERNPGALAAALRKLLVSPEERQSLGKTGRAWALENVSMSGVAAQLAQAVERAIADRPRS